jgi:Bacteriophage tail sheath protein
MSNENRFPGVFVEEIPGNPARLIGVETSIVCFIGRTFQGPINDPQFLQSYPDFENMFGSDTRLSDTPTAVSLFFQNGGTHCWVTRVDAAHPADAADYTDAFDAIDRKVDLFNLLILPRDNGAGALPPKSFYGMASRYCERRKAILIMDPPDEWANAQKINDPLVGIESLRADLVKESSAIYFPSLVITDADGSQKITGPSGAIAGIMSRIDSNRGVWKAPAGEEADIRGIADLSLQINNRENEMLDTVGINVIRKFPAGILCWGARTIDGDNSFASEWKYIPVRRTALFIEASISHGLEWVVSEPNNELLWAKIRLVIWAFMNDLFLKGAFQGIKPDQAFFVKCDAETTTQDDIDNGIVNILVGFAPLKPAEFVIIKLQQLSGQVP